ncbi:hypothetical protein GCM10027062_06360 [Nocardioides hungaricus]
MNDRIPRNERDRVLVDVKAKPSGWPMASLDPDSGRGPRAPSGMPAHENRQNQVSTVSGDCHALNAPHLVALVRAGAAFKNGVLVERDDDQADDNADESGGEQQVA